MDDKKDIVFYSNQLPTLKAGKYTVTVSQEISGFSGKVHDSSLDFVVSSPQISLDSKMVYSVYPPHQSAGVYKSTLPHIILSEKTLPWARELFKESNIPWMYLFVFSEDEGVVSQAGTFDDANKSDEVFIPKLKRYSKGDEKCIYLDIPYKIFKDCLPLKEELPYLSHVREVGLINKVTDKDVKDGWFSCVVSNRYPKEPTSLANRIKHEAHLVSLEGFSAFIEKPDISNVGGKNIVRMFSLARWTFFSQMDNLDFYGNAQNLKSKCYKPEISTASPKLQRLMNLGYSPINHQMREGTKTVSWYRPMLVPQRITEKGPKNCNFSDSLLRYDPNYGMFDISYQTAWQLGRLLALTNKGLQVSLINFRFKKKQEAGIDNIKKALMENLFSENIKIDNFNKLINKQVITLFKSIIDECGVDDYTNLKSTSLENTEEIAKEIIKNNLIKDNKLSQKDLLDFLKLLKKGE